jgi:hypothetical protein
MLEGEVEFQSADENLLRLRGFAQKLLLGGIRILSS